jgi:hypothetical protein
MKGLLAGVLAAGAALPLWATDPGTAIEAAALAKGSLPGLVRSLKGIYDVPCQAVQCLKLPLGLSEMVLSPFPGIGFMEGVDDTVKGVVAPFKFCKAVIDLPGEFFGGLGDAITGLAD